MDAAIAAAATHQQQMQNEENELKQAKSKQYLEFKNLLIKSRRARGIALTALNEHDNRTDEESRYQKEKKNK